MKQKDPLLKVLLVVIATLFTLSCGALPAIIEATATPVPTNTPAPTEPPVPTNTTVPSPIPSPTEDPLYTETLSQVQKFVDAGHIPDADGEYIKLADFDETFAQIGYYQAYPTDLEIESFVFIGRVSWETASATNDLSGCGILFAQQEDTSDYAVFLDKSRIFFSSSTPKLYYELGKTRGSGRLNFGNPAEADFNLVVFDNHAYVYVDDTFIGEYTLAQDKKLRGIFGYGIISGTNRDFGTRCEITNARIWSLNP